MREHRSVSTIVISAVIGLAVFIIALAILNHYSPYANQGLNHVVAFLNTNLVLLIVMSLIFMLGELFGVLFFPFNLPAPLINAIASMFLVTFIIRMFGLIDTMTGNTNFGFLKSIDILLYVMVFMIVLVIGYVMIAVDLLTRRGSESSPESGKGAKEKGGSRPKRHPTWEDIGQEIRERIYEGVRRKRR